MARKLMRLPTKLRVMEYLRTKGYAPTMDDNGNIVMRIKTLLPETAQEIFEREKETIVLQGYIEPISYEWIKKTRENTRWS